MTETSITYSPSYGATPHREETRKISSTILQSDFLEPCPQDTVRVVEIEQIQEVIKEVPKIEYVEVEKRVPKYEYEFVDKYVEVPQIQFVDKTVEVPQIEQVVRTIMKTEFVDVTKEVLKEVPRIEKRSIEQRVEVPGEIIEVPKPYQVIQEIEVPMFQDVHQPVIVAQTLRPIVIESDEEIEVEVVEWEPEVIPVEVHVPKGVSTHLVALGAVQDVHRVVDVPAAHYNTLLKLLNNHITEMTLLPFLEENGNTPFLPDSANVSTVAPMAQIAIQGFEQKVAELSAKMSQHGVSQRGVSARGVSRGLPQSQPIPSYQASGQGYRSTQQQSQQQSRAVPSGNFTGPVAQPYATSIHSRPVTQLTQSVRQKSMRSQKSQKSQSPSQLGSQINAVMSRGITGASQHSQTARSITFNNGTVSKFGTEMSKAATRVTDQKRPRAACGC